MLLNEPANGSSCSVTSRNSANSESLHLSLLQEIERSSVDRVLTLGARMQRAAVATGGRTTAYLDLDALMQGSLTKFRRRPPASHGACQRCAFDGDAPCRRTAQCHVWRKTIMLLWLANLLAEK